MILNREKASDSKEKEKKQKGPVGTNNQIQQSKKGKVTYNTNTQKLFVYTLNQLTRNQESNPISNYYKIRNI